MPQEIISVTKTRLADPQIQAIVADFYGQAPKKLEIREFTSGQVWFLIELGYSNLTWRYSCYNAAYLLTTENGPVVLKVAPKPSVKVLRYEHNILDAETRVLNIISRTKAPLRTPKVHKFDQSCKIIEAPYAIIDYIPGENLDKCRKSLSEADALAVDRACGQHLAFLNAITRVKSNDDRPDGPVSEFGLCAVDAPRFSTWREAFSDLLLGLLADAQDAKIPGIPHEDIKSALATHAGIFDEVTEARLVVWDQWDGNILVTFSDPEYKTGASVAGTIDYERALWGDPLMETTFRALQAPAALVEAYGAYNPLTLTHSQRGRRIFYDLHLSLIWVIETTFRGLQELEHGGKDMEGYGRMGIQMSLEGLKAWSQAS